MVMQPERPGPRSLANSLALPARAARAAVISSVDQLHEVLAQREDGESVLVLGGGSNVVLPREVAHLTLVMQITGVSVVRRQHDRVQLEVGAGESWQGFVRYCIGQRLAPGIENLSLIPGTVGAAPIQNIGAYGVEVAEFVQAVEVVDLHDTGAATQWLSAADCQFGYRDSVFKQAAGRWVITRVRFEVPVCTVYTPRLAYAGLALELERMGGPEPTQARVAEAVTRLRRSKLPDPKRHPNAGSFFKNPVLDLDTYTACADAFARAGNGRFEDVPHWHQGSSVKVAAAALIERAGLKRKASRGVGVWYRQPLVLLNLGSADAGAVQSYAHDLVLQVKRYCGIELQQEPISVSGGSRVNAAG